MYFKLILRKLKSIISLLINNINFIVVYHTKKISSVNPEILDTKQLCYCQQYAILFFSWQRRTFRAWDMHALILIFCRLHAIDTELTQCLYFCETYIQVIEWQVIRCNFLPRLLRAATKNNEEKVACETSLASLPFEFTFGVIAGRDRNSLH